MKKLTDRDIESMASREFVPDANAARAVVRQMHLSQRIPPAPRPVPAHATLDLHQKTQEQAWCEIMALATSGVRDATIITGASGILHALFPQWARESILAPYIVEFSPINNGSFAVKFHKQNNPREK